MFAELVAKRLDIPFHLIDLSDEYRRRVVDYMFAEYGRGRTPNPDVLCNREIKFDAFLKAALDLGADYVATGHYCRREDVEIDGRTVHRLLAGSDPNKDQSYFLCQLTQRQLSRALFPIGHLLKPEGSADRRRTAPGYGGPQGFAGHLFRRQCRSAGVPATAVGGPRGRYRRGAGLVGRLPSAGRRRDAR